MNSSLVSRIEYDDGFLTVYFHKYFTDKLSYANVPFEAVQAWIDATSQGSFYHKYIKQLKMADKVQTQNKASKEKRLIRMSINLMAIDKEFIIVGEKGVYANITLVMKPDGEIDDYGNLGMVVQDVPTEVYKKDKTKKGAILGNGKEFIPRGGASDADTAKPISELSTKEKDELLDDLPF